MQARDLSGAALGVRERGTPTWFEKARLQRTAVKLAESAHAEQGGGCVDGPNWWLVKFLWSVGTMVRSQHNAWIHSTATVGVVAAASLAGVTRYEWVALILAVVSVWTAEAMNTALEFLCDVASPAFHPLVEKAKDVAAGAVLIAALGALSIALVVFAPYF